MVDHIAKRLITECYCSSVWMFTSLSLVIVIGVDGLLVFRVKMARR